MHQYRLTRRFVLPEAWNEASSEQCSAPTPFLLIACSDGVLDDSLIRSAKREGAYVVRTRGGCVNGPAADPALPMLIERIVAERRISEVVISGHSRCSCFASPSPAPSDAGSQGAESWYERSVRRISQAQAASDLAQAHVAEQTRFLKTLPWVERSGLRVTGWFYLCECGSLLVLDERSHTFRAGASLDSASAESSPELPPI